MIACGATVRKWEKSAPQARVGQTSEAPGAAMTYPMRDEPQFFGKLACKLGLWRSKAFRSIARLAKRGDCWLDPDFYGEPPEGVTRTLEQLGLSGFALLDSRKHERKIGPDDAMTERRAFAVGLGKNGRHVPLLLVWRPEDAERLLHETEPGKELDVSWQMRFAPLPAGAQWLEEQEVFLWRSEADGAWRWGGVKHRNARWIVKHPRKCNFDWKDQALGVQIMLARPEAVRQAMGRAASGAEIQAPGKIERFERARLADLLPEEMVERAVAAEQAQAIGQAVSSAARAPKKDAQAGRTEAVRAKSGTQASARRL
jgi:hypothetical protein